MRTLLQFLVGVALVVVPGVPVLWMLRAADERPPAAAPERTPAVIETSSTSLPANPRATPVSEAEGPEPPTPGPAAHEPAAPLPAAEPPADGDAAASASDGESEPPIDPDVDDAPGNCTVRLRFTDEDSGRPLDVSATLWRLGIPETRRLTAGDALREELDPSGGVRLVAGLPAGRYRVSCSAQRAEAGDPPEFSVSEHPSEVVLPLRMPRTFTARLLVFDETGARISRGALGSGFGCSTAEVEEFPEWVRRRSVTVGPEVPSRSYPFEAGCREPRAPGPVVDAGDPGFELGTYRESSRSVEQNSDPYLALDGRASVVCRVSGSSGLDRTFVGVAPKVDLLLANVRRPNGDPVSPSVAHVRATCRSVPFLAGTPLPPDAWRTAPVHVRVRVPGFRRLDFVWTVDTAHERHVLDSTPR